MEAVEYHRSGQPSALFAAIFRSGSFLSVEEILTADPTRMDSISREIFNACACGLVLTLLDQPSGPDRLKRFMADLDSGDESISGLLRKHFPALQSSRRSMEKWWALQVAFLAEPNLLEVMTIQKSEAAVQSILQITFTETLPPDRESASASADKAVLKADADDLPESLKEDGDPETGEEKPGWGKKLLGIFKFGKKGDDGDAAEAGEVEAEPEPQPKKKASPPKPKTRSVTIPIEQFERISKRKDRKALLQPIQVKLSELSQRAFPSYRPILAEYTEILREIGAGKRRGLAERLAKLRVSRTSLATRAAEIEDHMNWYQAVKLGESSGVFDAYLRAADEMENAQRAKRTDRISQYLDEAAEIWK
jgi:hypothetical protein